MSIAAAARFHGVSRSTLNGWLKINGNDVSNIGDVVERRQGHISVSKYFYNNNIYQLIQLFYFISRNINFYLEHNFAVAVKSDILLLYF